MGTIIIRFFNGFSHCDLYPFESQQSFASGTEIVNKSGNGTNCVRSLGHWDLTQRMNVCVCVYFVFVLSCV
jgi:hypothetical protein